jgi:hypothetical protein
MPFAMLGGEDATWVLLAGLPSVLGSARSRLEAAGVEVLRSGRWLGEPIGGVSFDWFMRCRAGVERERLRAALGTSAVTSDDAAAKVALLEQRLVELRADLALLEGRLRAAGPVEVPVPGTADPARDAALEAALAQVRDLQAKLDTVPQRAPASRSANRLLDELGAALVALRPDVTLLRDSLQVAVGEFQARAGFYRALQELPVGGGRPPGWKALRGADRWWERHLSTGQDDSGRAYARFDTESRHWGLLIGWKGEQGRDIDWIARQAPRSEGA